MEAQPILDEPEVDEHAPIVDAPGVIVDAPGVVVDAPGVIANDPDVAEGHVPGPGGQAPAGTTRGVTEITSIANPRRTRLSRRRHLPARLMINAVRPYDWGSRHVLARIQGRTPGGSPEAELWVGAHPAAPSRVVDSSGHSFSLDEAITADPARTLGSAVRERFGDRLPFLMKILAIERALSIQVHPSPQQAREGFAKEIALEGAGESLSARTFVDPYPKPELLYAITPVQALAGLREPIEAGRMLDLLDAPSISRVRQVLADALSTRRETATLAAVLELATWPVADRPRLVEEVAAATRRALAHPLVERHPEILSALLWVLRLTQQHPVDPLVLAPLLMSIYELKPNQTIFLPAGAPHAYLSGTAVEIMAASDNVVRAGLTSKAVNPAALSQLTDAQARPILSSGPHDISAHERAWRPPVEEFQLTRVEVRPQDGALALAALPGPQIVLCLRGTVVLHTGPDRVTLQGGSSAFVGADSPALRVSGDGEVFRAAVGVAQIDLRDAH